MAAWGALSGLGAGLQQLGGNIFKTKVLDKLREEEEIRKEKRQEAREAKKVVKEQLDPSTKKISLFNNRGEKIGERDASIPELDAANRDIEKGRIDLETSVLRNRVAKDELDYLPKKRALEEEKDRANIRQSDAQAEYYRLGGSSRAKLEDKDNQSFEDTVDEFVKDSKALYDQYVGGNDATGKQFMSASEFRTLASEAVEAAAKRGSDPRSFFADHLRRYLNDPRSPYSKGAGLQKRKPLDLGNTQ